MTQVRLYGVEKKKGWDILNGRDQASGNIPKTVTHVHITWADGKDSLKVERDVFLSKFTHQQGFYWNAN